MSKEQDNLAQREKVVKRGVAALTALSLMATGCVAVEGGQVMAKIADEPTKTSPLSLDFTKTPISSPTDVNYELTPTIVNPVTQELTLVSPTEVTTEMPTLTLTPEPTATVNPETETVDEELAEKIKSFMPKMWVYNSVSKSFEVRNPNEFSFLISKRTKLLISDKEGNEVGFAKYFNKNSLDSQATVYYSLTDKSIDTLIF
jgi:hypothetical protein